MASFGPWLILSAVFTIAMLVSVWAVAIQTEPGYTAMPLEGRSFIDLAWILERNVIVLALHAFVCVAAYLAGSAVPAQAARYRGLRKRLYASAGPMAMVVVGFLIISSLLNQILVLGHGAAALAEGIGTSPGMLLAMLSLHALPELIGLFLPMAAFVFIARARRPQDMVAAAIASSAIAAPLVLGAAVVEVWLTPVLVGALVG